MPYLECSDCGQLLDVVGLERTAVVRDCPVCEEPTEWTLAFAADSEGVSF